MLGVVTNKPPLGAYRGFGAPQAMIAIEGMLDLVAAKLGHGPGGPEAPQSAASRAAAVPEPARARSSTAAITRRPCGGPSSSAGTDRWREEQRVRRANGGRLLGIGIAFPIEIGGQGPCQRLRELQVMQGGYETAHVRIDVTGRVTVSSGIMEIGQGVNTALAQICAEELGVDVAEVDVVLGDTERTPYSNYGTGASRGTVTAGIAVLQATRRLKGKVRSWPPTCSRRARRTSRSKRGRRRVRGAAFRGMSLGALAEEAYRGQRPARGHGAGPRSPLRLRPARVHLHSPPPTWPSWRSIRRPGPSRP